MTDRFDRTVLKQYTLYVCSTNIHLFLHSLFKRIIRTQFSVNDFGILTYILN